MIKIKVLKKIDLKGFTFIEGFPGVGLVGPMAISYIVDKVGMEYIGYIDSNEFPPLVAIHSNKPMPPVRLYANQKTKTFTILAEFAIPVNTTYDLSDAIYDFIKSAGISGIISVAGLPSQLAVATPDTVFSICSTDKSKKDAQKAGLKQVGEGVATGVSALILLRATQDSLNDINILVPVDPNILDPKYAEAAVIAINKLLNLKVDVSELEKEAKEVEEKIKELLARNKQVQDAHKKTVDAAGPSMYA